MGNGDVKICRDKGRIIFGCFRQGVRDSPCQLHSFTCQKVFHCINLHQFPSTSHPLRGAIDHQPRQASERLQHGRGPQTEEPGAQRVRVGPRNLHEARGAASQNSERRWENDAKRLLGCSTLINVDRSIVALYELLCVHIFTTWSEMPNDVLSVSLHARRVIACEKKVSGPLSCFLEDLQY